MRFGLLILTVFIHIFSQEGVKYQYDENGHILFLEVVETSLSHEVLLENAADLMALQKENTGKQSHFEKKITFKLYRKRLGQSPHGEVSCSLELEVRENRYRYIIKEFKFQPLSRDRYGRYTQKKEEPVGVEEYLQKPNKVWAGHKKTILEKITQVVEDVKLRMNANPTEENHEVTIKIDEEW